MEAAGDLKETRGRTFNERTKAIRPKETLLCYENEYGTSSEYVCVCMYVCMCLGVVPQTLHDVLLLFILMNRRSVFAVT